MVGRAAAVLARPRALAFAAILAALAAYYAVVEALPPIPTWADVLFTALVLTPAVFALVLLALPLREARGLLPTAAAFALLTVGLEAAHLDVAANFGKLAAATLVAFWFLGYFERLSWVVIVAAIIPVVDSISVWRGPTRQIVEKRPDVFDALSFAFPVWDRGSFQLGLPDLLFFGLFLGAAARWLLRVNWTWIALVASFGATMALAIYADPLELGGLPALPLLSIAFLVANADVLWRELRRPANGEASEEEADEADEADETDEESQEVDARDGR